MNQKQINILEFCRLFIIGTVFSFSSVFISNTNAADTTAPNFTSIGCIPSGWTNQTVTCSYTVEDSDTLESWYSYAYVEEGISSSTTPDAWAISKTEQADSSLEATPFSAEQNQTFTITGRAMNNAQITGEMAAEATFDIQIDTTPPTISSVTCTSKSGPEGGTKIETDYLNNTIDFSNGWTNEDVTCEYTLEDPNPDYNSQLESWEHDLTSLGTGDEDTWPGVAYTWEVESSGACSTPCGEGTRSITTICKDNNGNLAPGKCKTTQPTSEKCFLATCTQCNNGKIEEGEACDDGNEAPEDGCSSDCTEIEPGWFCRNMPSICTTCGNGTWGDGGVNATDQTEACDDGNRPLDGDGCSTDCIVETNWNCSGTPSICTKCGNVIIDTNLGEECEDDDEYPAVGGDGCSDTCEIEAGWECYAAGEQCCRDTVGDPCEVADICKKGIVNCDGLCEEDGYKMEGGCDPIRLYN